jgi:hypothetical protein
MILVRSEGVSVVAFSEPESSNNNTTDTAVAQAAKASENAVDHIRP